MGVLAGPGRNICRIARNPSTAFNSPLHFSLISYDKTARIFNSYQTSVELFYSSHHSLRIHVSNTYDVGRITGTQF
jgi:hypothetical protein